MNPHEAYDHICNDPYVGPSSQEAARKLFNAYRKQLYRRQRQKTALNNLHDSIDRHKKRVAFLEAALSSIIYNDTDPETYRGLVDNASCEQLGREDRAVETSEPQTGICNGAIPRAEAAVRRA